MAPCRFRTSTSLSAPPEEVFRFHENPANLKAISPAWLSLLRIEAAPVAREGEEFRLGLPLPWLPPLWVGQWATVQPPNLLVDTARRFPFREFRHRHLFDPEPGGGTLLTDDLEFVLPWFCGGAWVAALACRLILPAAFRSRHRATRAFFRDREIGQRG